jgi:hypothetical protein
VWGSGQEGGNGGGGTIAEVYTWDKAQGLCKAGPISQEANPSCIREEGRAGWGSEMYLAMSRETGLFLENSGEQLKNIVSGEDTVLAVKLPVRGYGRSEPDKAR